MRVGIDLGTNDACIARVDTDQRPTLIGDHAAPDDFQTPSTVHVFTNGALVGRSAEQLLECDPELPVVRHVSRRIGEREPLHIDEGGSAWHAEGIAALLLKKLRFDAEAQSSSSFEGAVIAVPAHFSEAQRQSVLAAAALADVPVLGLVDEPVAVALYHHVGPSPRRELLLVVDIGGAAFDVSVLASEPSGHTILARGGLGDRGGRKIDDHVGALLLAQFERALGAPLSRGARTMLELKRVSEEIKLELMTSSRPRIRRQVLLGGQVVEIEVGRAELEPALEDLSTHLEASLLRCLKDAGTSPADLKTALVCGGTAQIPSLVERVRRLLPGVPLVAEEPDRAVACGAAIRAAHLGAAAAPLSLPPELKGVTGHAVGLRTIDAATGRVGADTLIKKNMPLPAKAQKTYYTTRAGQRRLVLDCVEIGDDDRPGASLGQLLVEPLAAERPNYALQVTATYREDGAVKIEAYDAQTGVEVEQVFGGDAGDGLRRVANQRALVRAAVVNGVVA
jgi:molecular chaperone DnaK